MAHTPPTDQEKRMSIAVVLSEGSGTIFENKNRTSDAAPVMIGYMEFPLNKERNQKLKLEVAVWLKQKNGSNEKFYSLSVGGINASLFKEADKKDKGPDYAGSFGFNHEMRIAGWRKEGVDGGAPFISLSVTTKVRPVSQPSPAADATTQGTPSQDGQVDTGDPRFQF
jgi:hypothetical protein|nr:hypothetical protein [Pseudomonas putida]